MLFSIIYPNFSIKHQDFLFGFGRCVCVCLRQVLKRFWSFLGRFFNKERARNEVYHVLRTSVSEAGSYDVSGRT